MPAWRIRVAIVLLSVVVLPAQSMHAQEHAPTFQLSDSFIHVPTYPPEALARLMPGHVELDTTFDDNGKIVSAVPIGISAGPMNTLLREESSKFVAALPLRVSPPSRSTRKLMVDYKISESGACGHLSVSFFDPDPDRIVITATPHCLHVKAKPPARGLVSMEPINYPLIARRSRIAGVVVLSMDVSASGVVTNVTSKSGHPMLLGQTKSTMMSWRFEPAAQGSSLNVTILYVLDGRSPDSCEYTLPDALSNPTVLEIDCSVPMVYTVNQAAE